VRLANRVAVWVEGIRVDGEALLDRNFKATCGKVEQEGCSSRRFGFARSVAEPADALLRAALRE
jgi:hypothetical protein